MFGTKFKYRPRKILLLTTFNVSKCLQYNDFFPRWESSVRENQAGTKVDAGRLSSSFQSLKVI